MKFTILGDGLAGKTCFLVRYTQGVFPESKCVPTLFQSGRVTISVKGQDCEVDLTDTAGQEEYDVLRRLAYKGTSCFLLCFDIDNRASYKNVSAKWVQELRPRAVKVPILLVGMKKDLRKDTSLQPADGFELKKLIKAFAYVECSALTGEGVADVISLAYEASLHGDRLRATMCCVLS